MPFTSKRQLATCYSRRISAKAAGKKWTWNCDEFLDHTQDPMCLPSVKGSSRPTPKCRNLKKGEKVISPVYVGARGGVYFYVAGVKVYVPKGKINIAYAKKTYGYGGNK